MFSALKSGLRFQMWGTVVSDSAALRQDVIVKFDPVDQNPLPWYSGAEELIRPAKSAERWSMKPGTRVILEYITSHSYGLWFVRLPKQSEIDPKEIASPQSTGNQWDVYDRDG